MEGSSVLKEEKDIFWEICVSVELECPLCGKVTKVDIEGVWSKLDEEEEIVCECGYNFSL